MQYQLPTGTMDKLTAGVHLKKPERSNFFQFIKIQISTLNGIFCFIFSFGHLFQLLATQDYPILPPNSPPFCKIQYLRIHCRLEEKAVPKKLSSLAGRDFVPLAELKKQPVQENYYETGSESDDNESLSGKVIIFFFLKSPVEHFFSGKLNVPL